MSGRWCAAIGIVSCVLAGCGDAGWNGEVPVPDRAMFDKQVYPMLLRDCAFAECHGGANRFFQVYGPGRSRLHGHPSDPDLVPREKELSYQRAAAMLVAQNQGDSSQAPLLTKPLEVAAGGASHLGVDAFGRNAFQNTSDSRYQLLLQWGYTARGLVIPPQAPANPPPVQTTPGSGGPSVGSAP